MSPQQPPILTSEQQFAKALYVIAKLSQFKLEDDVLGFYVESLRPHGLDAATKVVLGMTTEAKPGKGWPSVQDILNKMGHSELPDEAKAVDVSRRLEEAVRKYGYNNWEKAREHIGPIGEYVVGQGGWVDFCESLTDYNLTTMRAQWRQMALAAIAKERQGLLDAPPAFKQLEGNDKNPALQKALDIATGKSQAVVATMPTRQT
jgi:hypothetical protein